MSTSEEPAAALAPLRAALAEVGVLRGWVTSSPPPVRSLQVSGADGGELRLMHYVLGMQLLPLQPLTWDSHVC